jgi:hypothetical protein
MIAFFAIMPAIHKISRKLSETVFNFNVYGLVNSHTPFYFLKHHYLNKIISYAPKIQEKINKNIGSCGWRDAVVSPFVAGVHQ